MYSATWSGLTLKRQCQFCMPRRGAGNTAKNVATLGAKAVLIGVVGDDDIARRVEAAAREEGYELNLVRDASRPTTEKIRYIVRSQQMLRVDYEEAREIPEDIEKELLRALESVGNIDAIIVSDYAKGVVTAKVAEAVMRKQTQEHVLVMADVKPSRAAYFVGVSIISPNRKEAHEYLGVDMYDKGGRPKEELAQELRKKFGSDIYLTLSEEGIYVLGKDREGRHVRQEHEVEVADTSGAGDTAAVAIALSKLAGGTDVEAAELANAAGAIVVSRVGAVGITPEVLLNMVVHKHA